MADESTRDLRAWALKGAELRLVEIAEEAAAIHRTFPELRDRVRGLSGGVTQTAASQPQRGRGRRKGRRRNLSAEGRSRIAEAARRRWAEWKARREEAETPAAASTTTARAPKKR
jgi:hypothetical protein